MKVALHGRAQDSQKKLYAAAGIDTVEGAAATEDEMIAHCRETLAAIDAGPRAPSTRVYWRCFAWSAAEKVPPPMPMA